MTKPNVTARMIANCENGARRVSTVFFSYSHRDEDLRDQLEVHLAALRRKGIISTWHDRKITAGHELDLAIDRNLARADVILLLISPDFIASEYCYERELKEALLRHSEGKSRVIPVILRPCDWHDLPFGNLLATPTDGRAITLWQDRDQAFLDVVTAIKRAVRELAQIAASDSIAAIAVVPSLERRDERNEVAISEESGRDGEKVRDKPRSGLNDQCIGIDLGTSSTRIYVAERGIVLEDRSLVAINKNSGKMITAGDSSWATVNDGKVVLIRPMREGAVSDPACVTAMLRNFLSRVGIHAAARAVIAVPPDSTSANLRVLREAVKRAKVSKVHFVESTSAAALNTVAFSQQGGSAVLTIIIGAGLTSVAVIEQGHTYYSHSVRVGGDQMNESITRAIKRVYKLLIGERTAEQTKNKFGSASPVKGGRTIVVKGRNLVSGSPDEIESNEGEMHDALSGDLAAICQVIHDALDRTPPSVRKDLSNGGVELTGGGALMRNIAKLVRQETGLRVRIPDEPFRSVIDGIGYLSTLDWSQVKSRSGLKVVELDEVLKGGAGCPKVSFLRPGKARSSRLP